MVHGLVKENKHGIPDWYTMFNSRDSVRLISEKSRKLTLRLQSSANKKARNFGRPLEDARQVFYFVVVVTVVAVVAVVD